MDELTLLANALMALDDKLAACMKCGMCQSVCPVFGETMMEADVTRGKLTLLEKLAHRLIEDPDPFLYIKSVRTPQDIVERENHASSIMQGSK